MATMAVFSMSCNKLAQSFLPGFDVKVPDMQVIIPSIPIVPSNEMELGSFTLHFNLDSTIKANTNNVFNMNSVASMKVSQMLVTVSNGTSANNLSNFESARLLISSNANSSETALASFAFPSTETYSFNANTDNAPDILGYYKGTEITYKLFGKLRKPTTASLNLALSVTIRVN